MEAEMVPDIRKGMTYRQVERALRRAGFSIDRYSGGHAIYKRGGISVPVRSGHPTLKVPPNTINMMIRQSRGDVPVSWGSCL